MSVIPALYSGSPTRNVSGPPFVPTSADNGLSIDTVSGRVVLGQNVGQVGNPARLLNNREIPLNGFQIDFRDPVNSTLIRFNNVPLNPLFLQADVNAQWSNIIAQNANAGNLATSFMGSYNDQGDNISIVKTSTGYTGNFGYTAGTGIVYSSSVGGARLNAMAFVAESGFYWAPNTTGAGGFSQVAMRMLTNGNLQLYPIGTGNISDIGTRVGVFGRGSFSSYAGGEVRTTNIPSVFTVAMNTELSGICVQDAHNTSNAPIITLYKSRGTAPNTPVTTNNNDQLGRVLFQGVDASATPTIRTAFEMRGFQAAAAGAGFVPGGCLWFTTNLAGVNSVRMWLSPDGGLALSNGAIAQAAAGIILHAQAGFILVGGTATNTYRWAANTAAPATTAGGAITAHYGGDNNYLGDPVEWLLVDVNGTNRKIPCYAV